MKVTVCGRIHSDNLGDAAIMQSSLRQFGLTAGVASVSAVDIDGVSARARSEAMQRGSRFHPALSLHRLAYSTSGAYGAIFNRLRYSIKRDRLIEIWRDHLQETNLLAIGGGQLLQFSRLFFPLRIADLVQLAGSLGVSIVFIGVGVGSYWPASVRRMLGDSLRSDQVRRVICRDRRSAEMLEKLFPDIASKVEVLYDLAILYPRFASRSVLKPRIAISPISPNAVARIGLCRHLRSQSASIAYWASLIRSAKDRGLEVDLITNGTREDAAFVSQLIRSPEGKSAGAPTDFSAPTSAEEFFALLTSYQAVIAARMHACILSWSAGVPFAGVIWDRKISDFASMVNATDAFFEEDVPTSRLVDHIGSLQPTSPDYVATAQEAIAQGFSDCVARYASTAENEGT